MEGFFLGVLMFYGKYPIIHLSPHQGTIRATVSLSPVLRGFFLLFLGFLAKLEVCRSCWFRHGI